MKADRDRAREEAGGSQEIPPESVGAKRKPGSNGADRAREGGGGSAAPGIRPRVLSLKELLELPKPRWLINQILGIPALALLYGPPGCGKTFVALYTALAVAAGRKWCGYGVKPGVVLYIACEGLYGLPSRVMAWRDTTSETLDPDDPVAQNFKVLSAGVSIFDDAEFEGLMVVLRAMAKPPLLVVIDTLARAMTGGDENETKDMSRFVRHCDQIRHEIGSTVLVVHHPDKEGKRERGSSVLRGDVDVIMSLKEVDGSSEIELKCEKQKDADAFSPLRFRLEVRPAGTDDEGRPITSRVAVHVGSGASGKQSHSSLKPNSLKILTALRDSLPKDGASANQLFEVTTLAKSTFYRHLRNLESAGYITSQGRGDNKKYRLTAKFAEEAGS